MSHRNARLTVHGRRLIVQRHEAGWKKAHIAAAMGVSRKCVSTWVDRYAEEGEDGLVTRSSRPHKLSTRTSEEVEEKIVAARAQDRCGPDVLGPKLGVPARTVSRVLRRHEVPYLRDCDPMTGNVIRSSKSTAVRYERERPGDLVHVDVKKIGKIPDGGGWRAHGRAATQAAKCKRAPIGYDYVHSMVDDHSRLAYSEIHDDEKADTCAGFLTRAAAHFAAHGISTLEQVMTDNAFSYRNSRAFKDAVAALGSQANLHQAPLPLAERQGRTLQPDTGHRMGLPAGLHQQPSPTASPCAMATHLQH